MVHLRTTCKAFTLEKQQRWKKIKTIVNYWPMPIWFWVYFDLEDLCTQVFQLHVLMGSRKIGLVRCHHEDQSIDCKLQRHAFCVIVTPVQILDKCCRGDRPIPLQPPLPGIVTSCDLLISTLYCMFELIWHYKWCVMVKRSWLPWSDLEQQVFHVSFSTCHPVIPRSITWIDGE